MNNINKIEEIEDNKKLIKSSTFNKEKNIAYEINNINEIPINNENSIQKSRTIENQIPRLSFTLRFNNMGPNHLETVLETVSEASNSKVDSSEISDENEDNKKNEEIENKKLKLKEESVNNISSDLKIQTETRMNDSDFNSNLNKKSLYFLSSEKTH